MFFFFVCVLHSSRRIVLNGKRKGEKIHNKIYIPSTFQLSDGNSKNALINSNKKDHPNKTKMSRESSQERAYAHTRNLPSTTKQLYNMLYIPLLYISLIPLEFYHVSDMPCLISLLVMHQMFLVISQVYLVWRYHFYVV